MEKTITLTESRLKKVISECTKQTLNEIGMFGYDSEEERDRCRAAANRFFGNPNPVDTIGTINLIYIIETDEMMDVDEFDSMQEGATGVVKFLDLEFVPTEVSDSDEVTNCEINLKYSTYNVNEDGENVKSVKLTSNNIGERYDHLCELALDFFNNH